jgi:hypothetical protein
MVYKHIIISPFRLNEYHYSQRGKKRTERYCKTNFLCASDIELENVHSLLVAFVKVYGISVNHNDKVCYARGGVNFVHKKCFD